MDSVNDANAWRAPRISIGVLYPCQARGAIATGMVFTCCPTMVVRAAGWSSSVHLHALAQLDALEASVGAVGIPCVYEPSLQVVEHARHARRWR